MARLIDIKIGRKVRHGRWMMGMPRKQLADAIGMPLRELAEIEKGTTPTDVRHLHLIALALELPVAFFFEDATRRTGEVNEARAELLTTEQALALLRSYRVRRRRG